MNLRGFFSQNLQFDSPPIEQQFVEVSQKIWGNSKHNDKLKAEFKSILVPKNCTFMKTPYLNPEIYSRISDPAVYLFYLHQYLSRLKYASINVQYQSL